MNVIDPSQIPTQTLASGAKIPAIGLGTFGSDKYSPDQVACAVLEAGRLGYRHFDCAAVYGNEAEIGKSLTALQMEGINRDGLWITSKVWNDQHDNVAGACKKSLVDLQLDYLDLYLIHWPYPNFHAPHVGVDSRDPNARPYSHAQYMDTWRQMEELQEQGLVRHIGASNMTRAKLDLLLRDANIAPAACEMELHPHFQQPELFQFCIEKSILPIGYSPLGSPSRPERDRAAGDSSDIDDPIVKSIGAKAGLSPAQVCIKWAIQRGQVPIPFSVKPEQYTASLEASITPPLPPEDMDALSKIDRNCRLIKGQVFLWEGATGWEDLWDLDGTISDLS